MTLFSAKELKPHPFKTETSVRTTSIFIDGFCTLEITGNDKNGFIIKTVYDATNCNDRICLYEQFDPSHPDKNIFWDIQTQNLFPKKTPKLETIYTVVERYEAREADSKVSLRVIGTINLIFGKFTPTSSPK